MSAAAVWLSALAGAVIGPVAVSGIAWGAPAMVRGVDVLIARAGAVTRSIVAPLRLAGSHGDDPSAVERRRLGLAGALAGGGAGWLIAGRPVAIVASIAAGLWLPRVPAWRRAHYGRRVESGAAPAALAMSAALAGGGSIRAAIEAAARELDGPISVELRRTAVELAAGGSLDGALDGLAARAPSRSIVRVAAAIQLQRRSGGDLAWLLRRIAGSLEDERRATEEARTATSQARVTSVMVLALPPAGMLLAELASPGLAGRMLSSDVGASLLVFALGLQIVGALAVRRLARISS